MLFGQWWHAQLWMLFGGKFTRATVEFDGWTANGVYKGRQKRVNDDAIRSLASEGVPKAQIARDLSVSRMTIYRALEKQKAEPKMNENS